MASGLESLENFIKTTQSGRADFTQVVTPAVKAGQVAKAKSSTGTFEFSRPGRFRFVYKKPFEQTIVADGQTLWLYDTDLNQVTARKQADVLGSTPAALIASAVDINALKTEFNLVADSVKEGQDWVLATPKAKDGQLQNVRIGFRAGQLATLEILDSFGQKSTMTFTAFEPNVALPVASFQFKPPAGADVVRQ